MKQSCSSFNRLSQSTVLAMLQAPSVLGIHPGERVQYIDDNGKTYNLLVISVARDTVRLSGKNISIEVNKNKVKKDDPAVFLDKLSRDQWSVTSFNPRTRIVCILIDAPSGPKNISVTLPVVDFRLPGQ